MNIEQRNKLVLLYMDEIKSIAQEVPLHKYQYVDQEELVSEGVIEFIQQIENRDVQKSTQEDLNEILFKVKERMVRYAEQ